METKFEIGDVVSLPALSGEEYTVTSLDCGPFADHVKLNGCYLALRSELTLVRRASAQREGGFAVGQRVKTSARWAGPSNAGFEVDIIRLDDNCAWTTTHPSIAAVSPCFFLKALEPADTAPAQPVEPPQPAPMTRAARVLAGMERDPYERQICFDTDARQKTDSHPRNEAARLRMAKMSLDRPLDAERARWERLVCATHPVTSRSVRGRR